MNMENKSKFTPGPWEVFGHDVYKKGYATRICKLGNASFVDPTIIPANARLIAAAPEMLEGLKLAVEWIEWLEKIAGLRADSGNHLQKIKSVITKALGK